MNLLVVGAGAAGVAAAIRGAQLGAQVTLVERQDIGGTCVNRGCIPLKTLLHSINDNLNIDLKSIASRRDTVVSDLREGTEGILASYGITVLPGEAVLKGAKTVQVENEILTPDVIIWSGGAAYTAAAWNSPGVINLGQLLDQVENPPPNLMIFGNTALEMEMAYLFAALNSKVILAVPDSCLLPEEDAELGQRLFTALVESGIEIVMGAAVNNVQSANGELTVDLSVNGSSRSCQVQNLVLGERRPSLAGLEAAESLGLKVEDGKVVVDKHLATSLPGIYAAGDVTGGPLLSHKASAEGRAAAVNALGGSERRPRFLPNCIYTQPEIASVGLSEEQAEDQGFELLCVSLPLMTSARAYTLDDVKGCVKVVAEKRSNRLLGVHIIGPRATDLIGEACLALEMELTLEDLAAGVRAHPTLSESLGEAARVLLGQASYLPKGWA